MASESCSIVPFSSHFFFPLQLAIRVLNQIVFDWNNRHFDEIRQNALKPFNMNSVLVIYLNHLHNSNGSIYLNRANVKPRFCEVRCDEYDLRSVHFHRVRRPMTRNSFDTEHLQIIHQKYPKNYMRWCCVYKTMCKKRLRLHFAPIFFLLRFIPNFTCFCLPWEMVTNCHCSAFFRSIKSNIYLQWGRTIFFL